VAEPSGSPPGPAHAARTSIPAKTPLASDQIEAPAACVRYLQRGRSISSTPRGCCECTARFGPGDLDLWPWHSNSSERRTKHVFRVNLMQMRSIVPAIHCRMRVSRIERVSPISRINGRQTISVNSGIGKSKLTKFLRYVDRTHALLTHPSAFPSCHPLWNASPKKEGVPSILADFALKIGCHSNVPSTIGKAMPDWTSTPTCLPSLKIWWRLVF